MANQDLIISLRAPEEGDRLKGQKLAIVNTAVKLGEATREKFYEKLANNLETRQDPARVFTFYANQLTEAGFIRIEKAEKPEGEAKPKKAKAKKKKAAAAE